VSLSPDCRDCSAPPSPRTLVGDLSFDTSILGDVRTKSATCLNDR
jgi:hypothetical protein